LAVDQEASVNLLHMMYKARMPLYLYDHIYEWAHTFAKKDTEIFRSMPPKREQTIDMLKTRYGLQNCEPSTIRIKLPSERFVEVVTFDVYQAIFSLLSDSSLMKEENLLVNTHDPCQKYTDDTQGFGDIHTGSLYSEGWDLYCTDDRKHVLAAFLFFIDKTHTDIQSKLTVEPVSITLSIFNRETRNKAIAWRTIGYVPNMDLIEGGTVTAEQKLGDYHAVLEHIFKQIYEIQNNGGLEWIFQFGNKLHEVTLKMPVMYFIGDTEGQDKLVGRYSSRINVSRLCRYCNTPYMKTDDPYCKFHYTKQKQISTLIEKGHKERLHNMAMYMFINATHKLEFCDPTRGIHGAVPFEVVHTIQLGWFIYVINAFFSEKNTLKEAKRQIKISTNSQMSTNRKNAQNTRITSNLKTTNNRKTGTKKTTKRVTKRQTSGPKYTAKKSTKMKSTKNRTTNVEQPIRRTQKDMSTRNLFNKKFANKFDKRARLYGRLLQQQSDRDLPRTYFAQGIIPSNERKKKNKKKFAAHEHEGVILIILIILVGSLGKEVQDALDSQTLADYISLFERLLLLDHFFRAENLTQESCDNMREYVPMLMDFFKTVIHRMEGCGCKFIKFHLMKHLVDDIERIGVCPNSNSGPKESHHIEHCKKPAKYTQRVFKKFLQQLGTQYSHSVIIEKAWGESRQPDKQSSSKKNGVHCYEVCLLQ
jgi:hypothetical protein